MKALGKGSIASIVKIGLQVFSVILWIGLGATALAGALLAGGALGMIAFSLDGEISLSGAGVRLGVDGPGLLSWPLVATALATGMVMLGGALIILDRLQRLFANFTSNEPFNRANAHHLRVIWMVMLAMEGLKMGMFVLVGWILARFGAPEAADVALHFSVNLSTWGSILVLIVLAEVFREGARMREDQDLTI